MTKMTGAMKGYTVSDLKKLLTRFDISFGKEKKNELLRLCVEHGLIDPPEVEYKIIEKTCIVKCGLCKALALNDNEFSKFRQYVDTLVNTISRMLRRSSLALAFHMTRLVSEDLPIPNLYDMSDTYWKNWLKIGVDGVFPDNESRVSYEQIKDVLGTVIDPTHEYVQLKERNAAQKEKNTESKKVKWPEHFDQVLNYAGHTLSTMVINNAWVPLFARLTRVTTIVLKTLDTNLKTYNVMEAIRSKEPKMDGWSDSVKDYVNDIRSRLLIKKDECMYDNYGKDISFETIFKFNHWMQTYLEDSDSKRIALMPICDVHRAHIRLDQKTLLNIFYDIFRDDPNVKELVNMKKDVDVYRNPDKYMLPSRPASLRKKDCTPDQWESYKNKMKIYESAVSAIKATPEYINQHKRYMLRIDAQHRVVSSFFKNLPKKRGWNFDCSIATDGVSVSLQYSKKVRIKIDHMNASDKTSPDKVAESYDKYMDTMIPGSNIVVLGVDPGRCNMATVTYQINGKGKMWKLTRGAYYNDSGIKKCKKQYNQRFAEFIPKWATLCGKGIALRTSNAQEIKEYLRNYNEFSEEWWKHVLQRRESRCKFQQYMGKRKVLDLFWASVRRKFKKEHPDMVPYIAYGSAIISMKSTGKREAAVPTGSMFSSCNRIFKNQVAITNEFRTTKVSWETGAVSEKVYKQPSIIVGDDGKIKLGPETLHHTRHSIPAVEPRDDLAVWVYNTRKKAQDKHRKGGFVDTTVHKSAEKWYPEVRGLRFSPETRMYFDRDRSAALTIARLRCMELQGLGRPIPFTSSFAL